jgi:hypothetical protein
MPERPDNPESPVAPAPLVSSSIIVTVAVLAALAAVPLVTLASETITVSGDSEIESCSAAMEIEPLVAPDAIKIELVEME